MLKSNKKLFKNVFNLSFKEHKTNSLSKVKYLKSKIFAFTSISISSLYCFNYQNVAVSKPILSYSGKTKSSQK